MDYERTIERLRETIEHKEASCFYLNGFWVESFDAPPDVPRIMITNHDGKWNYVSYDGEGERTQVFSRLDATEVTSYATSFVRDFLENELT